MLGIDNETTGRMSANRTGSNGGKNTNELLVYL
jgi:hypothetical protein